MSVDKMVEKAKQVLEKQKELNYLVIEMKEEVRSVEDQNKILQRENESLRAQLRQGNYSKFSPTEANDKQVMNVSGATPTPKIVPVEAVKEAVVLKQTETVTENLTPKDLKPVVPNTSKPVLQKDPRTRTQTQKNLIEFFLGKNVIVKIAAILMVLAVITFGQIAYVDFLDEVGRFILILSIGFGFIGLGYFFERKKIEVYANIFYIIGLATLLANNFFGRFEYELYNDYMFMYLLFPLVLTPLIYFYQKRYTFLDFALNIYFLVIMFVPIVIFSDANVDIQAFLLITFIIGITGFAVYRNYTHHMDKYDKFAIIEFVVLLIAATAAIVNSPDIVSTVKVSLAHMNVLMYQLFFVFIYYIIHFKNMAKRNEFVRVTILVTTTIAFFIIGSSLSGTFNVLINKDNRSLATLFTVVLFIPIYVYMFRSKQDKKLTNMYLIILSVTALFFTFFVKKESPGFAGSVIYKSLDSYLKNIILMSEVFVLYTFARITKDKTQKYLSYGFMGIALLYSLVYFASEELVFSEFKFFISSIIAGIAVYLLSLYINPSHKEKEEQDVVKLFSLAVFVPFILIFTKELIIDDASVMITTLGFYLVGIRYLFNLNIFKSNHHKNFTFGLNIAIVLFVFVSNLFYFDHNFSQFVDVLKLLIVGLANIYLIQALREIGFHLRKESRDPEKLFLIFYILGVAIQAIFITQFINFEFDKVILSSYYMIIAAVGILFGFRSNWFNVRKIGLFAIYFSLAKFFIYDFWTNDFSMYVRFISYFILALVLFGIAALYSYLEKTYGTEENKLSESNEMEK